MGSLVLVALEAVRKKCIALDTATADNTLEVDAIDEKDNRAVARYDLAMAPLMSYVGFDMAADGPSEGHAYLER